MKTLNVLIALVFSATVSFAAQPKTLYDFKVKDINGDNFDLSQLKGKKVLVVNTASKCGFTPQYADLEKLYETYKDKNFVIIGFPANNFAHQEPGSNEEISEFCTKNYGVTFPMMSKISVKGDDIDPLYLWLTTKMDTDVKWNFQKFMVNEKGEVVNYALSKVKPFDDKIVDWIKN